MISVAMTTCNGERYILQQLESILRQTHIVDEVIICDDRSTDNTVQKINKYIASNNLMNWRLYINEDTLGFSDNFWKAINLCKGDIIFLSDQDDIWYPNKVQATTQLLANKTDVSVVATSYDICNEHGDHSRDVIIPKARHQDDESIEQIALQDLVGNNVARGCSIVFKKSVLDNEYLFSHKQGYMGHDWYILFYGALKSKAIFYNKILFSYRVHSNNTSLNTQKKQGNINVKRLLRKVEMLSREERTIQDLCRRKNLNEEDRILFLKHAYFTKQRHDFIAYTKLRAFPYLTFNIFRYIKLNRVGHIKGMKIYFSDIAYMLLNMFWRASK